VATGRATIVSAGRPLADDASAQRWLRGAGERELADDLAVLGRALHAFRAVTADPYVHPVGRAELLVARIGYGEGEEVAEGRWSDARELAPGPVRARRSKVLEPQARLAAVLGGHEQLLACQELTLRARLDLTEGRSREAAMQLLTALDAALAELPADPLGGGLGGRLQELEAHREPVAAAARAALSGPLAVDARAAVATALGRLEAALSARALAAAGS